MEMHNCDSSLIARYGYDPKKLELDLDFIKGGIYRYFGVTMDAFTAFLRAPSKGKHFLAEIKGKYTYEKR